MRLMLACGFTALTLIGGGCGSSKQPVPVSGIVTLDGEPLPDARVTFNPIDTGGWMAFGQTDKQGRFSLTTLNGKPGALPGEYKITVEYLGELTEASAAIATDMKRMLAERDKLKTKKKDKEVHANYRTVDKTQLRQSVPPDGDVKIALSKSGGV
jgi:hypothetical protein